MIDLRSDTVTMPTPEMLETILSAKLGDDGRRKPDGMGGDETVGQLEKLAAEITAIEEEIKATMTEQGVEELTVDVFKIRWQTVTSNRFDSTAFKKAYPDLHKLFSKPTTGKRFTVA